MPHKAACLLKFDSISIQLLLVFRYDGVLGFWGFGVLGIKEGLVECATVCVKSVVILEATSLIT